MDWYLAVLKKYAVFTGRARRKEFWYFNLISSLIVIGIIIICIVTIHSAPKHLFGVLIALYYVAVLIPGLAVSVRRLHDTNRSGWWIFIEFVPIVGGILLLVFYLQNSQAGENRYGPNPKAVAPLAFS